MILLPETQGNIEWEIEWFTPEEIAVESENGTFVYTDELILTLTKLDELRECLGKPVFISNACRFDGSRGSQHYFKQFNALDIYVKGCSSMELMKEIEALDIGTARGLYPYTNSQIVHIDCRKGSSSKEGPVLRWWRDKDGSYRYYHNHYKNNLYEGWLEYGKQR